MQVEVASATAADLHLSEDVFTCGADEYLLDVVSKMAQKGYGCVVVSSGGLPVGIFTERDLLKRVVASGLDMTNTQIGEVMTKNPTCVKRQTRLQHILAAMRLGKFRHLVVTNEKNEITGVISIKDVLSWMTDQLNN